MADEKISAYADGAPALTTDEYVIARAGANFKLTGAEVMMLGGTVLLNDITLGSDGNIDLTSIPGGYKALFLTGSVRAATAAVTQIDGRLRFNNDSGSNYDHVRFLCTDNGGTFPNGALGETSAYLALLPAATATAGRATTFTMQIPDYAGTTFDKSFRLESAWCQGTSAGDMALGSNAGNWRSTAAITRITLFASSGNLLTGSRVSLWGLQ